MWRNRDIYIIPIALGILLLFLSIFWAPIERLILVSVTLVAALGWAGYHRFLTKFFGRIPKYCDKIVAILLSFLAIVNAVYAAKSDYKSWQNGKSGSAQSQFLGAVDEVRIYNRPLMWN